LINTVTTRKAAITARITATMPEITPVKYKTATTIAKMILAAYLGHEGLVSFLLF
jgi:hypothetical protein